MAAYGKQILLTFSQRERKHAKNRDYLRNGKHLPFRGGGSNQQQRNSGRSRRTYPDRGSEDGRTLRLPSHYRPHFARHRFLSDVSEERSPERNHCDQQSVLVERRR